MSQTQKINIPAYISMQLDRMIGRLKLLQSKNLGALKRKKNSISQIQ